MRPAVVGFVLALAAALDATHSPRAAERVRPNDNRLPGGSRGGAALMLHLEARAAEWHPDGDSSVGVTIPAFAERGHAPQVPGPLVRVPAGTEVTVTLHNRLERDTLVVHGLHARPGGDEGITLAPDASRTVRFRLDAPGTYYYYGTTTGRSLEWRTRLDAQLSGAIVVDAPGAIPHDRVFVIGMWEDTVGRAFVATERLLAVVNGRTWPHTERLSHVVGDTVRWRVINASADMHPMHLHGFYFQVESRGDGRGDTTYQAGDRVVTEAMPVGSTMRIAWVPERAGNWLFHCHLPEHVALRGPLGSAATHAPHDAHDAHANHATSGMSGLVLGIAVRPRARVPGVQDAATVRAPRHLRLHVRRNAGGSDTMPWFGFALQEDGAPEPARDSGLHIGPPLVLERGQPVRITIVNQLDEPTAVHWHGIELESYFDGVAGFSGDAARTSPIIAPRDSFEVRFTPPRAGTFIYHTHVDELRQQRAGLVGPIVVLEPGARWDPQTDHTVMVTSPWSLEAQRQAVLLNGSVSPEPLVLSAGVAHRIRVVNMTARRPGARIELRADTTMLTWRPLAKDGADLPAAARVPVPARRMVSIGETFDFEITPGTPGDLRLEVRPVVRGISEAPIATLLLRVVR